MTSPQRRATLDDLLSAIEAVTDQIKVLVSAVDDLRCEVEWQSRNRQSEDWASAAASSSQAEPLDAPNQPIGKSAIAGDDDNSLLSAAGRLQAYEKLLCRAPRGLWLDQWNEAEELDMLEIPVGRVFSVSSDMWQAIVDVRPAHVIDTGCDCEPEMGQPYLMAWRTESECLLRELDDEEARRLQELCLEWQAEEAAKPVQQTSDTPAPSQRGLF
jgi:hypothetical protein